MLISFLQHQRKEAEAVRTCRRYAPACIKSHPHTTKAIANTHNNKTGREPPELEPRLPLFGLFAALRGGLQLRGDGHLRALRRLFVGYGGSPRRVL